MNTVDICSIRDVVVSDGAEGMVKNLQLDIKKGTVTAFISDDFSAGLVLQAMAGFRNVEQGDITYPSWELEKGRVSAKQVQYVPDDIICYSNLKVKEYLHGVAMAVSAKAEQEGIRLCGVFRINPEEELLNLTFEQNRLVAMIQALVRKPDLLLLDRPYDMLGKRAYRLLWKEIMALQKEGTTVVFSAESYEDIFIFCDRYIFFQDGLIGKDYMRKDLPKPAKVITIEDGSLDGMNPDKMKILYKVKKRCRFLYWESNMEKLALQIQKTGCLDFRVEELSMEEEIFADYERWMS